VFSKLAAGVSLTPLRDLAFTAADAIRAAFFGSGKTLVGLSCRVCHPAACLPTRRWCHVLSDVKCALCKTATVCWLTWNPAACSHRWPASPPTRPRARPSRRPPPAPTTSRHRRRSGTTRRPARTGAQLLRFSECSIAGSITSRHCTPPQPQAADHTAKWICSMSLPRQRPCLNFV
jgi:hypothetical protein